jgi:zinc protease
LVAETRAVTPAHLAQVAAAAWTTGLLMSPARPDWAGFTAAPAVSDSAVSGHTFPSLANPAERLIVAPDGVSHIDGEDVSTVRHADCVLVRMWPDGGRQLIGADGITIRIEPGLFADGWRAVAAIDAGTQPQMRVSQPARDPRRIPQPAPQPVRTAPTPDTSRDRTVGLLGLLFFWPLTLVFGLLATLLTIGVLADSQDRALGIGLVVFFAAITAGGVFGIRRSARRRRG